MPPESAEIADPTRPLTPSRPWRRVTGVIVTLLVLAAAIAAWHWNANQPRNRYLRGRQALVAGDRRTAFRESQFLIGTTDFEPHGHLLAGLLLARADRPADALEELQHAAWDDETAVEALTAAAECYYALGQSQKVIEMARTALSRDENAIEARRWLAAAWYDLGAMANATSELEQISKADPGDPRSEFLLGLIAKDDEQFAIAVEHYQEALRRGLSGDTREILLLDLAESLLKLSRYEEALEVLKDGAKTPRALTYQSEALQGLTRQEEAYERVHEAIQLDPEFFPARLQLGSLLLFDQRTAEAVTSLEQAVRLAPHSSRAHFQLSQAYQRLGKTEESAEQVRLMQQCQALEVEFSELNGQASEKPADADLRFRIGQLAQKLGKPELAQMWFRAALALQPDHAGARQALNAAGSATPGSERSP